MRRLRDFWSADADVAPVAAFRILFGVQLFNWFWQLYPNLSAFFTDEGILPRRELALAHPDRLSLLNLSGDWWFVAAVWVASCLVAVGLTLGWHTRVMSLLAFGLVSSFSWRDPLILDGSDFVFRLVPLWLAFTPAGERWSIDARLRGSAAARGWAFPIRILELQIAWIYLTTGLEKLGGTDWVEGTAAYYALQLEHTFARPWAHAIAVDPTMSRLISWYTLAVELSFLPLALAPFRSSRTVAAIAAAAMHVGILVLMNVGNFPIVMLVACVLFVPPEWVHRVTGGAPTVRVHARPRWPRAAATVLAFVAAAALVTAVPSPLEPLRPSGVSASVLRRLSLDQRWDMFSPNPARSDWWLIAAASLRDGQRLDLLRGDDPDDGRARYSDPFYSRWTKVHERIGNGAYAVHRSDYARYLCHAHQGRVGMSSPIGLELHFVERAIRPPGTGPALVSESTIWSHQC